MNEDSIKYMKTIKFLLSSSVDCFLQNTKINKSFLGLMTSRNLAGGALNFCFDKVGRNMRQALQNDPNFAAENNTQST